LLTILLSLVPASLLCAVRRLEPDMACRIEEISSALFIINFHLSVEVSSKTATPRRAAFAQLAPSACRALPVARQRSVAALRDASKSCPTSFLASAVAPTVRTCDRRSRSRGGRGRAAARARVSVSSAHTVAAREDTHTASRQAAVCLDLHLLHLLVHRQHLVGQGIARALQCQHVLLQLPQFCFLLLQLLLRLLRFD